ncbi:hypothetical protein [Microbacterium lacus]|uniref:Uncharacterized protein n=1 Tax=Microbacterium lacus TaxID=415217 RepID=A0ABP4SSP0_9MICO
MTAVPAPRTLVRVTRFERLLLAAASAIASHVDARLEHRAGPAYRAATQVRNGMEESRRAAQARGAVGLLPR